ncbi:NAD(P)-binding protein [Pollutibacter soli]|uniref:NAD(P)-binding protein n=1 Tax=Pollutibacter soli TaxID=3034157 RepID=UPI003013C5E5
MSQKKLAVLGGGMGSLTCVYKITSEQNWQDKYDITVYQLGWRLGGKGASGRNGEVGQRIEEHGLHLWFGFYDNAFNLIQQCYKDNNRQPGTPLATWEEAFTGYNMICLEEDIDGKWEHWPITIEPNSLTPGYGVPHPTVEEYMYRLLDRLKEHHDHFLQRKSVAVQGNINAHAQTEHMSLIKRIVSPLLRVEEDLLIDAGSLLIRAASVAARAGQHSLVGELMKHFKAWMLHITAGLMNDDSWLRRDFIISDLAAVTIAGMVEDGVIDKGFDVINNIDYRDWLAKHDAAQITLDSAVVQAVYGLVFGGKQQYTFEAGTALRGLLRMALTFKGHVYYRMMAGMGDVIFAPMYQVLMARGVKFQFFSKVTNIGLTSDNKSIAKIAIDIQATLKDPNKPYNPLVNVNNLPSWPSAPDYNQLVQGDALKNQQVNLESYYSTWKAPLTQTLTWGVDFDEVILGISIGAFPAIASELNVSTAWANMVNNVIPIPTIAYQLWLKSSIQQMGWPYISDGLALLGSYEEPYDTWADMSDLIVRESWPAGYTPQNIAYFCGPTPAIYASQILKNAQTGNFSNADFPAQQTSVAQNYALDYVQNLSPHIWPGINPAGSGFDFNQLTDLNNGSGQARFNAQFFRANIDPTELYVMSFTNSSQYRIKTDKTDFSNLYITGDWIDNGFNAGCIEATVMSGLQTARAVTGVSFEIPGEKDK